nr:cytochrome c [uncultured Rhizobium sp.]
MKLTDLTVGYIVAKQQGDELTKHRRTQAEAPVVHRPNAYRLRGIGALIAFIGPFTIMSVAAGLDQAVVDRQRDMKEIAAATKTIADMFKSPETYSSQDFKGAAGSISDRADQRLVEHFKTVTTADASKASEGIKAERDRFTELARDLKAYADRLGAAADEHSGRMTSDMRMADKEPMGGGPLGTGVRSEASISSMSAEHAFHMMLQTCTACHSRFRKK